MKPDQLLNQLVVMSLTIFISLLVVMGVILFRQIQLQESIININDDLQMSLDDLEETTEDLQVELLDIQTIDDSQYLLTLDGINDLLGDVDVQLQNIEQDIEEIETALDTQLELPTQTENAPELMNDQADQMFTLLAVLVALISLILSVFLALAIRLQREGHVQIK